MSIKDDETPKHRSTKNRKKWCGGKVGREHDPMWEDNKRVNSNSVCWYEYICQRCHKSLDTYWRFEQWPESLSHHHTYEQPVLGSREPLKKREQNG